MKVCSTLFLYFSLAVLMACLTSLLTSFFSISEPVKKTLFFLFRISLSSLVTRVIVGEDCQSFSGNDIVHTEGNV